jgi:hypothetical protein
VFTTSVNALTIVREQGGMTPPSTGLCLRCFPDLAAVMAAASVADEASL